MENKLTSHFNFIDYCKNILFNATTQEQKDRMRKIIDYEKEQEKYLYIN